MIYDSSYYYNLLKIHTHTAKQISEIRWEFLLQTLPQMKHHPVILDMGSGVGWFYAFKPDMIKTMDTFDVMPVPQTGIRHDKYDIVTLWDVLEHIDWQNAPDKRIEHVLKITHFTAVTIPILPIGKDYKSWKHRKPHEHLFRFKSIDAVIHFFKTRGFKCIKIDSPESPPREDVYSFIFQKIR